ncbi:hypothetical protein [Pandoraea aquatica]|uniref:hypothetical protein n=1 Tax=Pandoraea aquatica TaxID=2508290 RepID=UPI001583527A|nr:hypothetical protein [Pandoraea aquatica]
MAFLPCRSDDNLHPPMHPYDLYAAPFRPLGRLTYLPGGRNGGSSTGGSSGRSGGGIGVGSSSSGGVFGGGVPGGLPGGLPGSYGSGK